MTGKKHRVSINGGSSVIDAESGQPLLHALESAAIYLPSACGGRGICGRCRLTVSSGDVEPNSTEKHHLSEAELAQGLRLACQLKVSGDLAVQIPPDVMKVKAYSARVESKRRLTHDMLEIRLAMDKKVAVAERPGQFVKLEVPFEGRPVHRAYSITSLASEKGVVELVVRLVPDGVGSLYVHGLERGDAVTFMGPYGDFRLNEDPNVEVVCVGGGSGIAPIKNIIYSIYERWPDRRCWLFFGCRSQKDVFYFDEFNALSEKHSGFKVVYALSEPDQSLPWDGETGFVHLCVDKHLKQETGRRQAFLSGPPPMIGAVMKVLEAKGFGSDDIFYDKF